MAASRLVAYVLLVVVLSASTARAQNPGRTDSVQQHSPSPLRTDSSATLSVTLPEVTVEEVSARSLSIPTAAHVTTIDSSAVAQSGAQSVGDLLALRSGTFVKQYGDTGLASPSLRGMGGNQTQVLLDGLRIADPQTGQLDLSLIPSLLIESVEVQHGAGSARHGSGSLGGTVHLHTLSPQSNPMWKAGGGGGAYGERYVSALASNSRGAWSGVVAGRYYRTDGDFPYRNSFLVPSQTLRRTGAGAEKLMLYGQGRWQGDTQVWTLSGWGMQARRGLPGPASARGGSAEQWDRLGRVWTEGTISLDRGTLSFTAQGQRSRFRFRNPPTRTDRTRLATSTDADAELSYPLNDLGTITAGSSVGYDHSSLRDGVDRISGATFVDATISASSVELQPAIRLDAISDKEDPTFVSSPRLGVSVRPLSWDGLLLRGLLGRAFRYPTFSERYREPGGTPQLNPEDGWTAEGGASVQVTRSTTRFSVDLTLFAASLTDKIVWQPSFVESGVQIWSPANVGHVYNRGLELELRAHTQIHSNLTLSGGSIFTHTRAENRANPDSPAHGSQLPYVPTQQLKLWGHLGWQGFSLSASGRLVANRYYTSDESRALPPYQAVDIRLAYEWQFEPGRLSVETQVENVLDNRYEIIRLYPMPPRHATLRLRFSFSSS